MPERKFPFFRDGTKGCVFALFPGIIAGFWLSGRAARILDRRWLRPVVLGVSAVAAVIAIVSGLW